MSARAGRGSLTKCRPVAGVLMTPCRAIVFESLIMAADAGTACPTNEALSQRAGFSQKSGSGTALAWLIARGLIIRETIIAAKIRRIQICSTGRWTNWSGGHLGNYSKENLRRIETEKVRRAAADPRRPIAPAAAGLGTPCFKCGTARGCVCRSKHSAAPVIKRVLTAQDEEDLERLALLMSEDGAGSLMIAASRLAMNFERVELLWAHICARLGAQAK